MLHTLRRAQNLKSDRNPTVRGRGRCSDGSGVTVKWMRFRGRSKNGGARH